MHTGDETLNITTFMPLLKSTKADDGARIIDGVISDETVDLQGESVPAEALGKSYPYLQQWGKLNWEHGSVPIGDVLEVRKISAEEAARDFGVSLNGGGTYAKMRVYPLNDDSPEDLRRAHYMIDSDAKLGYSLHGTAVRKGNQVQQVMVTQVALTGQPVNPHATVRIVKSLEALDEAGIESDDADGHADVLILAPELSMVQVATSTEQPETNSRGYSEGAYRLAKALLEAGQEVDSAKKRGGAALQRESLDDGKRRPRGRNGGPLAAGPGGVCVCLKCGAEAEHAVGEPCDALKCAKCGGQMTRKAEGASRVQKALGSGEKLRRLADELRCKGKRGARRM
jgi:hypothetical protein